MTQGEWAEFGADVWAKTVYASQIQGICPKTCPCFCPSDFDGSSLRCSVNAMLNSAAHALPADIPKDCLLSYRQAAELVSVSPRTVRAWVAAEKLPARWISARCVRVWRSDLMQLIEAHQAPAKQPSVTGPEPIQPQIEQRWKGRRKRPPSKAQLTLLSGD